MARLLSLCTWLLALGPGLLASMKSECTQDCATCSYHLVRPGDIDFLACMLECEGHLPSFKIWEACKELLQVKTSEFPQEITHPLTESSKQDEGHLLAKKYGGFMKRYGGFMKKMDELYPAEPEEEGNGGEILAKRYGGFMKKDAEEGDALANSSDLLRELLGTGDNPEQENHHLESSDNQEDLSKRYGGFMRGLRRSPQLEDDAKELQKRYGGFMRRVGRPEWWMDYQKRYGGFLKRFAESLPSEEEGESYSKEVPEVGKRYGGFMRF
ncbi:PREDICTED: proenkephalin-A [Dipodomys ordii]|uniref:Proenkephalin-A n=1 Tax=Dipodomys ordii TaxID=10020 RepID=A0A1S3EK64_DIPOR|nr:PREDICTED: proenkephalin-A [Dipodomys ordii]XP_012864746.1 PREDICTED: proenkephalin-A [Dipodomys ordii]